MCDFFRAFIVDPLPAKLRARTIIARGDSMQKTDGKPCDQLHATFRAALRKTRWTPINDFSENAANVDKC
jgi:hypothetical protein